MAVIRNNHVVECTTLAAILGKQSLYWGTKDARYLELVRLEVQHRQTCRLCNPALIDDELIAELWPGAVVK